MTPRGAQRDRRQPGRQEGQRAPMDDLDGIFARYEALRPRLPAADMPGPTRRIGSLLDITDDLDAVVFDAFGVLNVGDSQIDGAADRLDQLRARGVSIRILSNAASYSHAAAVRKFARLGLRVEDGEIVTSRDATLAALDRRTWGCIVAASDDLSDIPAQVLRLEDDPADYDRSEGILFLSSECWTGARQDLLRTSLRRMPRPVLIANADLVAPRETGFSLEPGHFGHLLMDEGVEDVRFFGKPFPDVYGLMEASLDGVAPARIAMCGDTLHTDILGAAVRGWQTVLVTRDGLFAARETQDYLRRSGLHPTWQLERI